MAFKNNSPGCNCCSSVVACATNPNYAGYWAGTNSNFVNITVAFGEPVVVIGLDPENKYFLAKIISTGEVWNYNPLTNAKVNKLWENISDVATAFDNSEWEDIIYLPTWEVGYGRATINNVLHIFSIDIDGNFINGPYMLGNLAIDFIKLCTITSNGDLYFLRNQQSLSAEGLNLIGTQSIFINDNIIDHANNVPDCVLQFPEQIEVLPPSSELHQESLNKGFGTTNVFSDGSKLYVSITGRTTRKDSQGNVYYVNELTRIMEFDISGTTTHTMYYEDIMGDYAAFVAAPMGCWYNPTQDRFEVLSTNIFSQHRLTWFGLQERLCIQAPLPSVPSYTTLRSIGTIIRPINIEDYWDAMQE